MLLYALLLARSGDTRCYLRVKIGLRQHGVELIRLDSAFNFFCARLQYRVSAIDCTLNSLDSLCLRSHAFALASIGANSLSPDHQPLARYCILHTAYCIQPRYSAYCLLLTQLPPSSATLATPLLPTACGTIK